MLAIASRDPEVVVFADIDADEALDKRRTSGTDVFRSRRPSLYAAPSLRRPPLSKVRLLRPRREPLPRPPPHWSSSWNRMTRPRISRRSCSGLSLRPGEARGSWCSRNWPSSLAGEWTTSMKRSGSPSRRWRRFSGAHGESGGGQIPQGSPHASVFARNDQAQRTGLAEGGHVRQVEATLTVGRLRGRADRQAPPDTEPTSAPRLLARCGFVARSQWVDHEVRFALTLADVEWPLGDP